MALSLVSWNVNSVRLRIDHVTRFLREASPDVICLQEIKCQAGEFPRRAFEELGYEHIRIVGQKGWHGIALCSRLPLEEAEPVDLCRRSEARCQSVRVNGIDLWNFYIPAGGDIPDRDLNDKFDHKLDFYEKLCERLDGWDASRPLVIMGDLNIAPGEYDVWSHRQMLRVVSHTPAELEVFARMMAAGQLHDPFRDSYPNPQKVFSWWSYRSADFRKSNRGLRLDHILVNPALKTQAAHMTAIIHDTVREWERPSDHVPVELRLSL